MADISNKVRAIDGIYKATGRDGWAVTDNSPRRPWRGCTVRWWLLGKVEDGWKEDDCRVFHRDTFLRPVAGYGDSLPGKGPLG